MSITWIDLHHGGRRGERSPAAARWRRPFACASCGSACTNRGPTESSPMRSGVNPGSMLHHVRALVETGFLRAEEPRRGKRGAREVPYRATGLSWRTPVDSQANLLVDDVPAGDRGPGLGGCGHHPARAQAHATSTARSCSTASTRSSRSTSTAAPTPTARRSRCSSPSTPTASARGYRRVSRRRAGGRRPRTPRGRRSRRRGTRGGRPPTGRAGTPPARSCRCRS